MSRAYKIIDIIREATDTPAGPIPLHAPIFVGNEQAYVESTIQSTFVSSVGKYVDRFEEMLREITGAAFAVATVNGTTALQIALTLAGASCGDIVLTQSLSFVGTVNAIVHAGAEPAFVDVDRTTLGLSPAALSAFLDLYCEKTAGGCRLRRGGKRIAACAPMHTFGLPAKIEEIINICSRWEIPVVEDAAEAVGSYFHGRHCGTFGLLGTLSFNGNKIVTCGGGGAILTDNAELGRLAKHLTTTAKVPGRWRFYHDAVGYNFRLPNLNAALGCAQLEKLGDFLSYKRGLADRYQTLFGAIQAPTPVESRECRSNYWLNAVLLSDSTERDEVLTATNDAEVMTRPVWDPMHTLPMYRHCLAGPLDVTEEIAARLVNVPSGCKMPQ